MDASAPAIPQRDPPARPSGRASVPPGLAAGMTVATKYELLRKIGSGAMGEVWAARHRTLDEEVAIKLVVRTVDNGDDTSPESRFLLEARVAAALSRKTRHIVAVTDHGQDGALGYLVMELLEGESLDARMARTGPLPLAKVVPMIIQIARGLSIAHGDGVVHRDLKPSNVFVTVDEEGNALAKVLDFGVAKLRPGDRTAAFATQRGFLLGTPVYMSPEQARGLSVDHRADVWALAVITYQLLTGEYPFDADSGDELFKRIIGADPIPIHQRRPELPALAADFFARAFARRLEDRFQSALALAGAFEQVEPLAAGEMLSLPPPPALGLIDDNFDLAGLSRPKATANPQPKKEEQGTLLVAGAGLPPKRRLLSRTISGMMVVAVLAVTGVLLVFFGRESREPRHPALSAGPTVAMPTSSARPIPTPEPSRPPEAVPLTITLTTPDDLPTVVAPRAIHRSTQHSTPGLAPSNPPPPLSVVGLSIAPAQLLASPPLKTAQKADKGEIF